MNDGRDAEPRCDAREFVSRGYDGCGEAYERQRSPSEHEREVLESVLDAVPEGGRVFDAGCGRGEPVLARCERRDDVSAVGLDLSRSQLEAAADVAPSPDLLRGDLARLPLAADSADAAIALGSLIHLPLDDHPDAVAELARVLRPGGELLLTEGTRPWSGTHDDWLGDGTAMTWSMAGMDATVAQLRGAGFELERRGRFDDELADEDSALAYARASLTGE